MDNKNISRRHFLKTMGLAGAAAAGITACGDGEKTATTAANRPIPTGKMTYRTNPKTREKVSILGYGMMRLPEKSSDDTSGKQEKHRPDIDQDMVNRQVDTAMAHGLNYFDTSPAYCQGRSEHATGIALSRHPRNKYFIATKLSNFAPSTWSREAGIAMYKNSLKELQTDYLDYMLLHAIGMTARDAEGKWLSGMEAYRRRYIDNGILDFLVKERDAGRIRNLGFSYHGDIEVFDHLLAEHDKYHWDFVQIQLNYIDWQHAKEINPRNTNGEYLYAELQKRGIPAVIMEPLLGGRLASVPAYRAAQMKERRPDDSVAAWAFRYAGTFPGVLTVLSGMTYMEHLEDNLRTYSPLVPCTEEEMEMLYDIAQTFVNDPFVPCTNCQYCMPCPYGLNIPAIFAHYNKCINEGNYGKGKTSPEYARARRAFLIGYDRSVPRLRQAAHCIGCGKCTPHCPQNIRIPDELHRIDDYVEQLKRDV